jgi:pilus assembly protein CpaC
MKTERTFTRAMIGCAMAAALAAGSITAIPTTAQAQSTSVRASDTISLSVGTGRMVRLDGTMSDLFVANDAIADVQVRSSNQIYVFGKAAGETTVYATDRAGRTIYSANVRVGNNIGSIGEMLSLTMPEAQIAATPMNGLILLTGTVKAPDDAAEAERLVQAFVGEGTQVISRLKTATPLQVMLKVRIAEVSRSLIKDIGVNLTTSDTSGGDFLFGLFRGRDFDGFQPDGSVVIKRSEGTNTLGLVARDLFGVDVAAAIDLNENSGDVNVLAEPTLVALSGETASFLAGGEFPIATTSGLNGTEIQFKEYGVSLAFTPFVLEGGRISMRVRPEVSELTSQGAITLGGVEIPALTTRRAETTVELGSGQSFMIGGLLRNGSNNAIEKVPLLGDIPILGALFRSTSFRRNETELVIIVTPYLVKPVNDGQIALPTDGFRVPSEPGRLLLDQRNSSVSGEQRPMPQALPAQTVAPGVGPVGGVAAAPVQPAPKPSAQPGFGL